MKTALIIALAAALAACAASSPRIDPARMSALKAGQTTFDDVVRQFGRPSVVSNNLDGTKSAIYLYDKPGESGTAMVSLISTSPTDSTTFHFDTKGVLTEYKNKEAERAAPAAAVPAATTTATATAPASVQSTSDKSAPAKSSPAPTPVKKPLPPNVTDRWPGSTTENR